MAGYVGNDVGSGQYFHGEWQLAGQETVNNRSLINWQSYAHYTNSDAQLDNGYTNSSVGMLWQNTGRVYNYSSNNTTRDQLMASGSFWMPHDANGNASFFLSGAVTYYQNRRSENFGTTWSLPRIPLAPAWAASTADTITTNSVRLGNEISSFGHGTSCSMKMGYRKQGASTWTYTADQADAFGYNYWTVTGLSVNTTYEYQAVMWNNNGDTSYGTIQTFKTKSGVKVIYPNGTVEDRVIKKILPSGAVSDHVATKIT